MRRLRYPHSLHPITAPLLALALLGLPPARGEEIYKSVDKDGKVLLSDTPPANRKVIKVIDVPDPTPAEEAASKARREKMEKEAEAVTNRLRAQQQARDKALEVVQRAERKYQRALDAQAAGKEPIEGERSATRAYVYGSPYRGAPHSYLNEAYYRRQARLDQAVADAKEELEQAREAYRATP